MRNGIKNARLGVFYRVRCRMAIIELVDRDVNAKKVVKTDAASEDKATDKAADKADKKEKSAKAPAAKVDTEAPKAAKSTGAKKTVAVKRRATGK